VRPDGPRLPHRLPGGKAAARPKRRRRDRLARLAAPAIFTPREETPMTDRRNVSLAVLEEKARFIRTETVRLTRIAGAGHYSSTFSCAEMLAALY
jgi:hypothetical protein